MVQKAPLTYDHIKSQKKPRTKTIRVPTDASAADEYAEASADYEMVRLMSSDKDSEAIIQDIKTKKERFDKAKANLAKHSLKFVFRSIGRKAFNKMILENPPTDKQKEEAARLGEDPDSLSWDFEKFPPLLVAACIEEPVLTKEQVQEIWDSEDWSGPELSGLFQAALEVNQLSGVVELGKD